MDVPWAGMGPQNGWALGIDGPSGALRRIVPVEPQDRLALGRDGAWVWMGPMSLRNRWVLRRDEPSAWMGPHRPSGWVSPVQGWAFYMNGSPPLAWMGLHGTSG